MGKFLNQLDISPNSDGETWTVNNDFCYQTNTLGCVITVMKGFVTDLASIPRIFWNILPPFGKYTEAAVIHDRLYQTKGLFGKYSRKQCDDTLYEGMLDCNVNKLTAWTIWSQVRMWGWTCWPAPTNEGVN